MVQSAVYEGGKKTGGMEGGEKAVSKKQVEKHSNVGVKQRLGIVMRG